MRMAMDCEKWFGFARCIIGEGTVVLRELLRFQVSTACFEECRKLWQMKTELCDQSNSCNELWTSLSQQFSGLDEASQNIIKPIMFILNHLLHVGRGEELPVLKDIEAKIQSLMNTYPNQQGILASWLTKIRGISNEIMSIQTVLDKGSDDFNHRYQRSMKTLMHLIKQHSEKTGNLMATLKSRTEDGLVQSKEELTSLIEECKLQVRKSLNCFELEICTFLNSWHTQIHELFYSMEKKISKLLSRKKYQLRHKDIDFQCSDCLGIVYDTYSAWHLNLHEKLANWHHQLESLNDSSDQLRCLTQSWLEELKTYPSLSDQPITRFLEFKRDYLHKLKTRRVLTEHQWSLLYPAKGFSDPNKFDMTLIYVLLKNTCAIKPPVTGWTKDVPDTDVSAGADIMRLRNLRNKYVAHIANTRLSSCKSEQLWSTLAGVLHRLSAPIGEQFQEKIERTVAELKQHHHVPYKQDLIKPRKCNQIGILLATNDKDDNSLGTHLTSNNGLENLPQQQATLVNEIEDLKRNSEDHNIENVSVDSKCGNETVLRGDMNITLNVDILKVKARVNILNTPRTHRSESKRKNKVKWYPAKKVRGERSKNKNHYRWDNIKKKRTKGSKLKNDRQNRRKIKCANYGPVTVKNANKEYFMNVTRQRRIVICLLNFIILMKLCRQYFSAKGICGTFILDKLYLNCVRKPVYLNKFTWNVFAQPFRIIELQPRDYIARNDNRFQYECIRLVSFFGYHGHGFRIQFAQAGFVFYPDRTMVACPWCGVSVDNEGILINAHRPNCDFVRLPHINIPFSVAPVPPLPSLEYHHDQENERLYDTPSTSAVVRPSSRMELEHPPELVYENDSPGLPEFRTNDRDTIETSDESLANGSGDDPARPFEFSNTTLAPVQNSNLNLLQSSVSNILQDQSRSLTECRQNDSIHQQMYAHGKEENSNFTDDHSFIVLRDDSDRTMDDFTDSPAVAMTYNGQLVNKVGSSVQDQSSTTANCRIRSIELPAPALAISNGNFTRTSDERASNGLTETVSGVIGLQETLRTANTSSGTSSTEPSSYAVVWIERNDNSTKEKIAIGPTVQRNKPGSHNTAALPSWLSNPGGDYTSPVHVMGLESLSEGKRSTSESATENQNDRRQGVIHNRQSFSAPVDSFEEPAPVYPHYALRNLRMSSFNGWPAELRQRPIEMVECGFYYEGFSDCVRCFYCGVPLRSWMSGDDPWIKHARWSPSCVFVHKMKGKDFVSIVKRAEEITEREEASIIVRGANQLTQNNTYEAPAGIESLTGQTHMEAISDFESMEDDTENEPNYSTCETNRAEERTARDKAGD